MLLTIYFLIAFFALPFLIADLIAAKTWQRKLVPAAVFGLLCCLYVYSDLHCGETVFNLAHPNDTIYSEGFSRAAFKKIHSGMRKEETLALLGKPLAIDIYGDHSLDRAEEFSEYWRYSLEGV